MRDFSKISPKFFTGEVGVAIRGDADAYAVAFYVMAGPMVNSIGLYRLPIGTLADELGIPRARVEQGLARLIDAGLVKYDERTMHIWIVDYMRHQWGGLAPNQRKGIESELMEHRISSVFNEFLAYYGKKYGLAINPSERVDQPIAKPMANTRDQRPETRDQRPEETKTAEPAEPASAQKSEKVGPKSSSSQKAAESRRLLGELETAVPGFGEAFDGWRAAGGSKWTAWAVILKLRSFKEIAGRRKDDVLDMLAVAARRSWQGFEETWYDKDRGSANGSGMLPLKERRFQPRDTETVYPKPEVFE